MLRKKLFFGFSIFVLLFTMIACKVAVDELAELQKNHPQPHLEVSSENIL